MPSSPTFALPAPDRDRLRGSASRGDERLRTDIPAPPLDPVRGQRLIAEDVAQVRAETTGPPPLPAITPAVLRRVQERQRAAEAPPPLPPVPARFDPENPLRQFLTAMPAPPPVRPDAGFAGLTDEAATAFGDVSAMFGQFALTKGMVDPATNEHLRARAAEIESPQLWREHQQQAAAGNWSPTVTTAGGGKVRALSPKQREAFRVNARYRGPNRGQLYYRNQYAPAAPGATTDSPARKRNLLASTANMETAFGGNYGRGIYALSHDGRLYVADQETERTRDQDIGFFHTSLLAGEEVAAAGEIEIGKNGRLVGVSSGSGHYQPDERYLVQILQHLTAQGVDISNAYAEHLGVRYPAYDVVATKGDLAVLRDQKLAALGVETHVAANGKVTRGWSVNEPGQERFERLAPGDETKLLREESDLAGLTEGRTVARAQAQVALTARRAAEARDRDAEKQIDTASALQAGFSRDEGGTWRLEDPWRAGQFRSVPASRVLEVLQEPRRRQTLAVELFNY